MENGQAIDAPKPRDFGAVLARNPIFLDALAGVLDVYAQDAAPKSVTMGLSIAHDPTMSTLRLSFYYLF